MPYISKDGPAGRAYWDPLIQPLIDDMRKLSPEEVDGVVNYVVTKVLREVYPARFIHYNKAMGVECIKQEYYRRVVAPYEDKRMQETGDVE